MDLFGWCFLSFGWINLLACLPAYDFILIMSICSLSSRHCSSLTTVLIDWAKFPLAEESSAWELPLHETDGYVYHKPRNNKASY